MSAWDDWPHDYWPTAGMLAGRLGQQATVLECPKCRALVCWSAAREHQAWHVGGDAA